MKIFIPSYKRAGNVKTRKTLGCGILVIHEFEEKEYKNKDLNIKEDEQLNEIDRILKLQSDKVSSVPQVTEDRAFAELTTPPLPNTPMPVVQTAALPGTNTNLTRTQQALLSPEEQVIASRRT